MLSTYNPEDEIFNKDYVAPPIKKNKEEEKMVPVSKNLLDGLPVKKVGKRTKRTRLEILKDARKLQKDIRAKAMKEPIIKEYKMALVNKKSKQSINTSSLPDQSTKMEDDGWIVFFISFLA